MSDKEIVPENLCACRHIKSWHDVPDKPEGCLGRLGECSCAEFTPHSIMKSSKVGNAEALRIYAERYLS